MTSSSAPPKRSGRSSTTPSRPSPELRADSFLRDARRVLCVGAGGGGDVVGALVVAERARSLGTPSVLGGVTWERLPIDPLPGPRALAELEGARGLNGATALAGPATRGPGGVAFAQAGLGRLPRADTLLLHPPPPPAP